MPGFFDRIGKAAQQTAAEGRIRLDIRNMTTQLDDRARALGRLLYRQHQGEAIADSEYTAILDEMTEIEAQRRAKEAELEDLRRPMAPPPQPPPPQPTESVVVEPPPVAEETPDEAVTVEQATPPVAEPAPEPAPSGRVCECGTLNTPTARFCTECGRPLEAIG